jgi:hypothetical protein
MTKTNEYGEEIETFRKVMAGWYQSPNYTIRRMPANEDQTKWVWHLYDNPDVPDEGCPELPATEDMFDKFICWGDTMKECEINATVESVEEMIQD